jgi:hypothetical protein
LLARLPAGDGARPRKGAPLEAGEDFNAVDIDPLAGLALQAACLMQLECHQLDRRWEHLQVRHPARQPRLLASLAESGQQTPIVVVTAEGQPDRYVVIDGYKRILRLGATGPRHSRSGRVADE